MCLTRRAFIGAAAAAPAFSFGAASPASASDPATIITALTILQKVIQLQGDRGDGGAGAILKAVNSKLDIVISQLGAIEKGLAEISLQISDLKVSVLNAIGDQYIVQLFNEAKTGLTAITDVQRRAKHRLISLDLRNPDRQGLDRELAAAWTEFDQARRRLRETPRARGIIITPILESFLLADYCAYAAGILDNARFSISVERHLNWLGEMLDPKAEYSIAAFIEKASNDERDERAAIDNSAKVYNDPASVIAAGLLRETTTEICAVTKMDVQFWSQTPNNGWYYLRNNSYTMAATYSSDRVDTMGAFLYKNTKYHPGFAAKVVLGNGYALWSAGPIGGVDANKCKVVWNKEIQIDSVAVARSDILNDAHDSTRFSKGIGSHVSQGFISNSAYARTISTNGLATAGEVQKLLDKINVHILNRRLGFFAHVAVTNNRKFARDLARTLPSIPR